MDLIITPEQAQVLGEWVVTGEHMALVHLRRYQDAGYLAVTQGDDYVEINEDGTRARKSEPKKPELQVEIKRPCLNMAAHKITNYWVK